MGAQKLTLKKAHTAIMTVIHMTIVDESMSSEANRQVCIRKKNNSVQEKSCCIVKFAWKVAVHKCVYNIWMEAMVYSKKKKIKK